MSKATQSTPIEREEGLAPREGPGRGRGGFVMLGPDHPHALHEMVRLTRPGGRVLLIAYGSPGTVDFLHCFVGAFQAVIPDFLGVADDHAPREHQAPDPEAMRRGMIGAGLKDVTVLTSSAEPLEFNTGQERWDWVLHDYAVTATLTADLTDEQRDTVRHVLDGILRECAESDGPEVLVNSVDIGIGTK
ncbi:MAG: hypothetical protein WD646_01865 [Actinomycetota bacterium]